MMPNSVSSASQHSPDRPSSIQRPWMKPVRSFYNTTALSRARGRVTASPIWVWHGRMYPVVLRRCSKHCYIKSKTFVAPSYSSDNLQGRHPFANEWPMRVWPHSPLQELLHHTYHVKYFKLRARVAATVWVSILATPAATPGTIL